VIVCTANPSSDRRCISQLIAGRPLLRNRTSIRVISLSPQLTFAPATSSSSNFTHTTSTEMSRSIAAALTNVLFVRSEAGHRPSSLPRRHTLTHNVRRQSQDTRLPVPRRERRRPPTSLALVQSTRSANRRQRNDGGLLQLLLLPMPMRNHTGSSRHLMARLVE
jgi:hypothetical protein